MFNLDIDECATNNSECSQVCINTKGSYSCNYSTGYDLGPDNHTYNGISTIHVYIFIQLNNINANYASLYRCK